MSERYVYSNSISMRLAHLSP
jgi:pyruvate dehydrogenase kinase 2/3/4